MSNKVYATNEASYTTSAQRQLDLILLACLWSPSGICLKIAMPEIPPISLIALSMLIASAVLLIYLKKQGISLLNSPKLAWQQGMILGLLCNGLPFVLQCYAIAHLQTIWLGLLNSMIPIITASITYFILPHHRLPLKSVIGLLLGFFGTLILVVASFADPNDQNDIMGILLASLSSLCYACGLVYSNRLTLQQPYVLHPFIHVASTLLYLIPLALIIEQPFLLPPPSYKAMSCVLILGIPSTALAFIMYYRILQHSGSISLATVNYLLPLFKTLLGVLLMNEQLTLTFLCAFVFIILGVYFINHSDPPSRRNINAT